MYGKVQLHKYTNTNNIDVAMYGLHIDKSLYYMSKVIFGCLEKIHILTNVQI